MFYHRGMTLGYIVPPTKADVAKDKVKAKSSASDRQIDADIEEADRDRDLSRSFLTPWHLFY